MRRCGFGARNGKLSVPSVTFPYAEIEAGCNFRWKDEEAKRDRVMRVLLVEDDERLSRGMAASLEAAGFAVSDG